MLRTFMLLLALPCMLTPTGAQDFVVEMSPHLKLSSRQVFQNHLFSDETGHYLYFHKYTGFFGYAGIGRSTMLFEKYSPDYRLLIGKDFLSDRDNLSSLGVKYMKGQFAWMVSEKNNKEDYIQFSVIPISRAGEAGPAVNLAKMRYERKRDMPNTEWLVSRDSSKLLFMSNADKDKKDQKFEMFLAVLDQDLTLMWEKQYKLDLTEEEVSIESVTVDNDGKVFVLAKIYEGNSKESVRKGSDKIANYKMTILQFDSELENPREFELNLAGSYAKSSSINITPQGDLAVLGFFSNDEKGLIHGVYLVRMDPSTGDASVSRKKEFSKKDFETLGRRNVSKKKGEEGLQSRFIFKQALFSENDASVFITAEQNYKYETVRHDANGSTSYQTVYASENIVMMNFNEQGEMQTIRIIPKNQRLSTDLYLSHAALVGKEKTYFFYNDSKKNLKKPIAGDRPPAQVNFSQAVAVATSVDQRGKMERIPLYKSKDMKSLLVPKMCSVIDDNTLFIVSMKYRLKAKNSFRMGRIIIKE